MYEVESWFSQGEPCVGRVGVIRGAVAVSVDVLSCCSRELLHGSHCHTGYFPMIVQMVRYSKDPSDEAKGKGFVFFVLGCQDTN